MLLVACEEATTSLETSTTTHTHLYATSVANATRQASDADERIQIEWFVGLGDELSDKKVSRLNQLTNRYNDAQSEIWVQLVILPEAEALEHLQTAQLNDALPDLIGPIRLDVANYFYGDWLDLRPYLPSTNLSHYSNVGLEIYEGENGPFRRSATQSLPWLHLLQSEAV